MKKKTPLAAPAMGRMALGIALLVGGCASPYVKVNRHEQVQGIHPAELAAEIGYARKRQDIYNDKIIELGEAERTLSNSLLGLGSLIVGMGVAKVHPSAITGTALVTGSVYTIGTFNTDKRIAQYYFEGLQVMDCAINAVVPLTLTASMEKDLPGLTGSVMTAIGNTSSAIGAVEQWSVQARGSGNAAFAPALSSAAQAVTAGQAAIDKANEATGLAVARLKKASEIGVQLHQAVDEIHAGVMKKVNNSQNDVRSTPEVLSGLMKNASLFSLSALVPSLVPAAPAPAASSVAAPHSGSTGRDAANLKTLADNAITRDQQTLDDLSKAIGELRRQTVALASLADRLSREAALGNPNAASDAMKLCNIDTTVKAVSVKPAQLEFAAKSTATQSFVVSGGKGPGFYNFSYVQNPPPALKLQFRRSPPDGDFLDVMPAENAAAGSYQLKVYDTTLASSDTVTVVVKAADAAGTKPDVFTSAAEKIKAAGKVTVNGAAVALSNVMVKGKTILLTYTVPAGAKATDVEVTKAVLALDGVNALLGDDASTIVAAPPASAAGPKAGRVGRGSVAEAGKWGTAVSGLSKSEVVKIQAGLCMAGDDVDGVWGPTTQAALKADRKLRANPSAHGSGAMLTDAEAAQLLDQTPDEVRTRCAR